MMHKIFSISYKTLLLCLILVGLNGCLIKPYRFDLYQGNDLTAEQIAQVSIGMSKDEVAQILGTPLLQDVFHQQRWDYIYYKRPGKRNKPITQHRFVIYFKGQTLSSIEHFN